MRNDIAQYQKMLEFLTLVFLAEMIFDGGRGIEMPPPGGIVELC
jgi:hypothetical protein